MTFELLEKIIKDNNIPKDVRLLSDSGWECFKTEMDGVFYNQKLNEIVFTQTGNQFEREYHSYVDGWKTLYHSPDDKFA